MSAAALGRVAVWLRPVLFFVATLAGAVTLVTLLVAAAPGTAFDALPSVPAEMKAELTARYGLDDAWPIQVGRRLSALAVGDFDVSLSYRSGGRVSALVWPAFQSTLLTVSLALALAAVAAALAVLLARRGPRRAAALEVGLAAASGIPAFVGAVILQALLASTLDLVPNLRHVLAAALVLAIADGQLVDLYRTLRTDVDEARATDHVVAARANGLSPRRAFARTLFAPVTEALVSRFTLMLGAALVVEIPFGLYGMGEILYQAASRRDTHLVVGCLVFLAATVCTANLLRDLARLVVDPRLRQSGAPRLE
jgi:peptide/nickel transport system permease protein